MKREGEAEIIAVLKSFVEEEPFHSSIIRCCDCEVFFTSLFMSIKSNSKGKSSSSTATVRGFGRLDLLLVSFVRGLK